MAQAKKKVGRPSIYNAKLGQTICERISTDISLSKLCETNDMPAIATVTNWLRKGTLEAEKYPKLSRFVSGYMRARQFSADSTFERIVSIEEKMAAGLISSDVGRAICQSMQWRAGKQNPRVYGEALRHVGHDGGPIQFVASHESAVLAAAAKRRELEDKSEIVDITVNEEEPQES